jgi:hypothetical protein
VEVTVTAVAVKVAEEAPEATVTVAGTPTTAELLEVRATEAPPLGAAAERFTVQVVEPALASEADAQERLETVARAGWTVTVADFEELLKVAVMVADWLEVTVEAVAVKVAEEAPAAAVTLAGTRTAELLEVRATEAPPLGAAAERFTVQVVEPALVSELAAQERLETVTGAEGMVTVTVPPVPLDAKLLPEEPAAVTFEIDMAAVAVGTTARVATTPF